MPSVPKSVPTRNSDGGSSPVCASASFLDCVSSRPGPPGPGPAKFSAGGETGGEGFGGGGGLLRVLWVSLGLSAPDHFASVASRLMREDVHTTGAWRRSLCDYSRRFKAKVKLQHEGSGRHWALPECRYKICLMRRRDGDRVASAARPNLGKQRSNEHRCLRVSSGSLCCRSFLNFFFIFRYMRYYVCAVEKMSDGGSTVWDSALVLLHFLAQRSERVAGREVLELGAGTGLVGLAAERIFKARRILLTDLPGLCPLLRVNLHLNSFTAGEVRPLLWQEAHCSWLSEGHSFSRVLMSDVLYHEPQYAPLLNVLRVLARSYRGVKEPLIVYWAQEAHNPELCRRLKTSLAKEGWGQKLATRVDDGLGAEIFVCKLTAPTTSKRSVQVRSRKKIFLRRRRSLRKLLLLRLCLRRRCVEVNQLGGDGKRSKKSGRMPGRVRFLLARMRQTEAPNSSNRQMGPQLVSWSF